MNTPQQDSKSGQGPLAAAVSWVFLKLIRLYQLTLSSVMGRRCRFMPSCSEYAADVIRLHGPWAGFWLALSRILSCNPWGGHGFDPAPKVVDRSVWKFWQHKHPQDAE